MSAPFYKNTGCLFPEPKGIRHFQPKNTQGVLAKFCSVCGSHLDTHAYKWVTGGSGTIRACPAPTEEELQQQQQHQQLNQSGTVQTPHVSQVRGAGVMDRSMQQQQQQQVVPNQTRPYGSHSLHHLEADVDLSLTSSTKGDRKTVGNVPAHHRQFYANNNTSRNASMALAQQQQQQLSQQDQVDHSGFSDFYADQQQQQQQQHGQPQMMQSSQHRNPQQQQQQLPGGDATAHFSRSFPQLYDEAFSTPVPFGTDVDLVNPPHVPGPKGKRKLGPMYGPEDHLSAASVATDEDTQAKLFPRMSAVRQKMEQSNLQGAGGINITQDAVRPGAEVHKSHIRIVRRDAQSKFHGAGVSWE